MVFQVRTAVPFLSASSIAGTAQGKERETAE